MLLGFSSVRGCDSVLAKLVAPTYYNTHTHTHTHTTHQLASLGLAVLILVLVTYLPQLVAHIHNPFHTVQLTEQIHL